MSAVPVVEEPALVETVLFPRRFQDLRGVRWRTGLGILPPSASIEDLRRVTADSRRRYAALRRQLLVDPHVPKDGSNSPDLMDNPLSQNPDSIWGRFFRNAELERMVDQDLSRLYPEHGSYFQTAGCQGMLRRILLIWCLRHPEYGYRQGMHEVLAPLLYVLHFDVEALLKVRKLYEDYFTDTYDGFSFHENDTNKFDFKKIPETMEDENGSERSSVKISSLSDLDPEIQTVVSISDAYGAEGELGILLSEKFMEHDAYCMFESLMNGAGGAVAMAEFFSPSPLSYSHSSLPPVIEASATLYHLLSIVDLSVHSHLVALGVEPQYFALRWLRVLFAREFSLEDLLTIWDEILSCDNSKLCKSSGNDVVTSCAVLDSSRGAFISALAVSMILHLRSSLLATENATSCLQKLLNYPEDINLGKLVMKAKSLQALAMDANNSIPSSTFFGVYDGNSSTVVKGHRLSLDSASPRTPLSSIPDSYWEERWRVLHKEEEHKQGFFKKVANHKKGWSEKVRLQLPGMGSDPSSSGVEEGKENPNSSLRRNLSEDLAQQLGQDEDAEKILGHEDLLQKDPVEGNGSDGEDKNITCTPEQRCSSVASEENCSVSSDSPSRPRRAIDHDIGSEASSEASNLSVNENDRAVIKADVCKTNPEGFPLPSSYNANDTSLRIDQKDDSVGKSEAGRKERKLSGKFQWLWKFGRHPGEVTSVKGGGFVDANGCSDVASQSNTAHGSTFDVCNVSSGTSKGETVDQNLVLTLRSLGYSMLENIQVIESVFQQDTGEGSHSYKNSDNVDRGQGAAMAALEELRKMSNLLSEMGGLTH